VTGLTRKCQYALRALDFLAREYGKGPVVIQHICAHANAPAEFLQTILLELKNVGLLESRRGPQGGYRLLTPPDRITVGSIVRLIDGPLVTLPCVGKTEAHGCKDCRDPDACRMRFLMREVHEAVTRIMDQTTIQAIAAA
jgi:Rrf2 family protein